MAKHCRNLEKKKPTSTCLQHMFKLQQQIFASNYTAAKQTIGLRCCYDPSKQQQRRPFQEAEKRPSGTHTKKLFRLLKLSEVSSQLLKHPLRGLMSFVEHWHHRARILVLGKALEKTKFKNPFAPFFSILKISRCLGAVRTKLKQKS